MDDQDDEDSLAAFVGLLNGLLVSVLLWVVLGTAVLSAYHGTVLEAQGDAPQRGADTPRIAVK